MFFFCYILECADGSYYTGWSTDPIRRLAQHNNGHGARYTKGRRPVRLVHVEQFPDQVSAMMRETQIKGMKRTEKQTLITKSQGEIC